MSVTYGFYDSLNGDRKYNAKQISELFDGLIRDGVFMSIGDALVVSAGGGMSVIVGTGRAWFNHTWTYNDAPLILQVDQSEIVLNRVDTVVLEVNSSIDVRANTIKIVKGVPSSEPVATELVRNEFVNQYPLAYIYVPAGATEIKAVNITNTVGTSDCPFVTGILESVDIDTLFGQWDGEFHDWIKLLQETLDENTAGNLLNLIEAHKAEDAIDAHKPENVGVLIATKAEAQAGSNNDKFMTPLRVKDSIEALAGGEIQIFTTSGVWIKPPNAKFVLVQVWGAGGGGGAGGRADYSDTYYSGAGGGGGGAFNEVFFIASELPDSVNVIVGAGGAGGSSNEAPGAAGGASSFYKITSDGGEGGAGAYIGYKSNSAPGGDRGESLKSGNYYTSSNGGAGALGNGGSAGNTILAGAGGGGGGGNSRGEYTIRNGGIGGNVAWLNVKGGNGGKSAAESGTAGNGTNGGMACGGGGGGSAYKATPGKGGKGGNGRVIVYWR